MIHFYHQAQRGYLESRFLRMKTNSLQNFAEKRIEPYGGLAREIEIINPEGEPILFKADESGRVWSFQYDMIKGGKKMHTFSVYELKTFLPFFSDICEIRVLKA